MALDQADIFKEAQGVVGGRLVFRGTLAVRYLLETANTVIVRPVGGPDGKLLAVRG
jgi:hypothetical protein